jgi:metal-sulfur cluster biosynthetic enzyme
MITRKIKLTAADSESTVAIEATIKFKTCPALYEIQRDVAAITNRIFDSVLRPSFHVTEIEVK